jgi:hypothetical protein
MEKKLFVPDLITIEFGDKNDNPFYQKSILIGIKTHASHKNDIDIYPFMSDEQGHLRITQDQINERTNDFISYGLMDYASLDSAKPVIELYFWGNKSIRRYLGYDTDPDLLQNLLTYIPGFNEEDFKRQRIEQRKQEKDYLLYEECFNRSTNIENDIILAEDSWDQPKKEVHYKFKIPV